MPFEVQLVSPEQVLFTGQADMVIARTLEGGDIAFQPGHTPFLGALGSHPVRVYLTDHSIIEFAVHGGFVEVSDDHVILLSDVAELPTQIDTDRARTSQGEAEAKLRSDPNDLEAQEALKRAQTRLTVAEAR
jgi:F-type H+-transporting ATPase subunit epsilon